MIAVFYYWRTGRPSRKMIVIGVTGTKGKSTTCRLIASVLQAAGHKVGLLSTIEFQIGERKMPNKMKMTMLGRGQIHKMLRRMVKADCRYAVVETSSQGILQYRHWGLNYDVAVFTNLAPEHIEAHGGFEKLKKDKGKIFAALAKHKKVIDGKPVKKVIIANIDEPNADYYLSFPADEKISVGINSKQAEIKAENIESDEKGVDFTVGATKYKLKILGYFNVYNALSAIAVGRSQEVSFKKAAAGLLSVDKVEGRVEMINKGQKFKAVVDYAHEPLSLRSLFTALRKIMGGKGRLIALIGSDGGGRDKCKRKEMGKISAELCDLVIITDVNCYDEDPRKIAEMLAAGAREAGKKEGTDFFVEINREEAIKKAVALARDNDLVVLTAKGTEPFIGLARGKTMPWDDREKLKEIIVNSLSRQ